MLSKLSRLLPCIVLLAACALPASVASAAVSDGAHIFSDDATAQAASIERDIRQRHRLDFNVETFADVPADHQPDLQAQGEKRFFQDWAARRFSQTGTNGVYVLICMDPHYVQVQVGNKTEQRAFTLADRDQLGRNLREAFKAKEYDRGLIDAAQFVRARMDANLGARAGTSGAAGATTSRGGGIPIFGWFCLILGVLAIFAIIRGAMNRPTMFGGGGYPPPPGYQGGPYPGGGYGGGGGFGRGLMGGLLGGVLGSAGYDWLSGRGRGGEWGGQPMPPGGGYDPNTGAQLPDVDTSSSGSGGSWDSGGGAGPDMGGGADFGGGGGGDSGGGADFGGGGDGGGGGDSGSSGGGDF